MKVSHYRAVSLQGVLKYLQQPRIVRSVLLELPPPVVHLVPPTGQEKLINVIKEGGVNGMPVDETDQVLSVVFPGQM